MSTGGSVGSTSVGTTQNGGNGGSTGTAGGNLGNGGIGNGGNAGNGVGSTTANWVASLPPRLSLMQASELLCYLRQIPPVRLPEFLEVLNRVIPFEYYWEYRELFHFPPLSAEQGVPFLNAAWSAATSSSSSKRGNNNNAGGGSKRSHQGGNHHSNNCVSDVYAYALLALNDHAKEIYATADVFQKLSSNSCGMLMAHTPRLSSQWAQMILRGGGGGRGVEHGQSPSFPTQRPGLHQVLHKTGIARAEVFH